MPSVGLFYAQPRQRRQHVALRFNVG